MVNRPTARRVSPLLMNTRLTTNVKITNAMTGRRLRANRASGTPESAIAAARNASTSERPMTSSARKITSM